MFYTSKSSCNLCSALKLISSLKPFAAHNVRLSKQKSQAEECLNRLVKATWLEILVCGEKALI